MCRLYECKHKPSFVRLCYLTGQPGRHVEVDESELGAWHRRIGCKAERAPIAQRGRSARRQYVISFRVPAINEDIITDQARYMDARVIIDHNSCVVTFNTKHGVSPNMILRAESFGWKLI